MPDYQYQCSACGHEFEVFHRFGEKPREPCPECGCKKLKMVFSVTTVLYKCLGFHATEYTEPRIVTSDEPYETSDRIP